MGLVALDMKEIPRLVWNDNTPYSHTPLVMLSTAEASLCTFKPFSLFE